MQGDPGPPYCYATAHHLPIPTEVRDLGSPAVLATPHVPRYPELMRFACERTRTENIVARGGNAQLFNLED